MRSRMLVACMLAAMVFAVGCSSDKTADGASPTGPGAIDTKVSTAPPIPEPDPIVTAPPPRITEAPPLVIGGGTATGGSRPVAAALSAPPRVVTVTPPAAARTGGKYTVQKGDTLWEIARKNYGSGMKWKQIASANPSIDPNKLRIGQVLTLP